MAPKGKKCSMCGTATSPRWVTLDRWLLCDACYDAQCNPPLEPVQDRDEEEAGPSGLGGMRGSLEAELATTIIAAPAGAPATNAADDAIFMKPTFIPSETNPTLKRTVFELPPKERAKAVKKPLALARPKPRKILPKLVTHDEETIRARSVQKVFHESFWYEVGDIVSLQDTKDNMYYAQIRGLIMDAFHEKSVVLTWLVPTVESPPPNEVFDPATYLIGPEEDEPRPLDHVRFVMHAPSGYYFDRHNPYPRPNTLGPIRKREPPSATVTSGAAPKFEWSNISHLHLGEHTAKVPRAVQEVASREKMLEKLFRTKKRKH